jgi:hypothetical protein
MGKAKPLGRSSDARTLGALKDWLSEANQVSYGWRVPDMAHLSPLVCDLKVPNKPTLHLCIFSPRCKPFFDIFPNANPNYREDEGLVLVLLKRRFSPSQHARPREPLPTLEPLIKLPREVLHQDPDISRGLMLLKLPQSTFERWKTAWQPVRKPRSFSLFTMETILFRTVVRKIWHGDQLPCTRTRCLAPQTPTGNESPPEDPRDGPTETMASDGAY